MDSGKERVITKWLLNEIGNVGFSRVGCETRTCLCSH